MLLEKLPPTSRIQSFGEYELKAYKGRDYEWYESDLAEYAKRFSAQVFGMDREEAAREVSSNVRYGGSIIIATLRNPAETIGYSTQRILEPRIDGNVVRIQFTTTALVLPDYQANYVGTAMKQYAYSTHDAPDIIGGRTRKAEVVRVYYNSGLVEDGKLYPFDKLYSESRPMQEALRYVVSQLRPRVPVDETTGLMREVYKEEFNSYDEGKASPELKAIHARMIEEFGLNPETGDAIVLLGVKRGWKRFRE